MANGKTVSSPIILFTGKQASEHIINLFCCLICSPHIHLTLTERTCLRLSLTWPCTSLYIYWKSYDILMLFPTLSTQRIHKPLMSEVKLYLKILFYK